MRGIVAGPTLTAAVVLILMGLVGFAPAARAAALPPGTFQRELAERRARFLRAGARPEAVVPLLGVAHLWDDLADRRPLSAFLEEAAAHRGAAPEVRAHAAYLRSLELDHQGRAVAARRARAGLGLIERFLVVGPFDNEGKAGQVRIYPPERELGQAIDLTKKYPGKNRSVSWREYPAVAAHGVVALDAVLRPDNFVTAYATVLVRAPRAEPVAVRVGSSGPIKVWVNGQLALDHDVYQAARFDADAAPAALRAGANRVTVKLSAAEGPLSFLLRLTAPDGSPLRDLTFSTDSAAVAPASGSKVARRHRVVDLGRALDERARRHPHDAEALRDEGLYLFFVQPEDPQAHRAADLLGRAAALGRSPTTYAEWAAAEQTDVDARRRALESGLAHTRAKAGRALLETALGKIYYDAHRERRAEALWRDALGDDPTYYPAALELAVLTADRGLPSEAAATLAALARARPALRVLRAEAGMAVRRGRRTEAAALDARIAAAEPDDSDALHDLFEMARDRGAWKEALALLDRLAAARPELTRLGIERADLLAGAGQYEPAERALEAVLALTPEDPQLLERDGKLLHRLGRDGQAVARLEQALALRPQNPDLRAYLAELAPKAAGSLDLARAYAVEVPPLIAHAPRAKSGEPERVLYDLEATRVHDNGLSEAFHQRVVQVLDPRGARDAGEVAIRYTPDTQSVELRRARVYKADGTVAEAVSTADRDLSEPWYGLYYDERAEVVELPALEPGDVVDVEYVVSDEGRRNLLGDYFGELYFFQEDVPRLESRYVLIAPSHRQLYFNEPRLDGIERTVAHAGKSTIYTFVARRVKKVAREPGMPGYSDVAAYLHVSTFRSWSEVAAFYRGLVAGQLTPDAAIDRAAAAAVAKITDERARIRALYDLVVRQTRYVGLEFGIHGYQPYRVSQVFARKFGDCKDKASLLVAMLRHEGIEASLVLARTRHGGDLDAEPASLAPFDHAIVYVPKYDWFLDGTAEFSGAGELPAEDQDIPVLIVSTGQLRRTPVEPAARNHSSRSWKVALAASGAAQVTEQLTVAGEEAHDWREQYQAAGGRLDRYTHTWNDQYPGARVERVAMPHLEALEQPVEVEAQVAVPEWGRPAEAGGLMVWALGHEPDLQLSYARLSERHYDLDIGYPFVKDERVELELPAGFGVRRLPAARTVESPFGHFVMTVESQGNTVVVTGALEIDGHRIKQRDYAAFRSFLSEVDQAVGQQLVVGAVARRAEAR